MSTESLIRGFFAFVFAATLGGAIYYKSSRETEEELEDFGLEPGTALTDDWLRF